MLSSINFRFDTLYSIRQLFASLFENLGALEAVMIDEVSALQALRNVKGLISCKKFINGIVGDCLRLNLNSIWTIHIFQKTLKNSLS